MWGVCGMYEGCLRDVCGVYVGRVWHVCGMYVTTYVGRDLLALLIPPCSEYMMLAKLLYLALQYQVDGER